MDLKTNVLHYLTGAQEAARTFFCALGKTNTPPLLS
jgi:hypothetical protein